MEVHDSMRARPTPSAWPSLPSGVRRRHGYLVITDHRFAFIEHDAPRTYRPLLERPIGSLRDVDVHSPRAARSLNTLARYIRDGSRLDPRLRELAILQVGYLTRSAWGFSHHVRIGREVGLLDDEIRAVGEETAGRVTALDPLAKAVLRAAREMTAGLVISDETFDALRRGLDNERLTDLVVTISFYNGLVRLLETMQVDVEEDYLSYLDEFPLPRR